MNVLGLKRGNNSFKDFIFRDLRGISNIIATLIMIILVLVSIGIIWISVTNPIESGTEQIEIGSKCLELKISLTKLECGEANNDVCNVTITRDSGGDEIAGIKLVFTNLEGKTSYVHDVPGNMAILETKTETNIDTGLVNVSNVGIVPYFQDSLGGEQVCSVTGWKI